MDVALKILVIDDSDVLCTAIKRFFENYDITVITSNNGLDGVRLASSERPDIIFLDLLMPDFGGIDVLKSISILDECWGVPVVIITSYQEGELIKEAENLGVSKIIYKPLRRGDVFRAVDEILGNHVLLKLHYKKYFEEPALKKETVKEDDGGKKADSARKTNKVPLKIGLAKLFVKTVDTRVQELNDAIGVKNQKALHNVFHELKGSGAMIGYNGLSMISEHILDLLDKNADNSQWPDIELFTEKAMDLLLKIKRENS